MKEMIAIVFGTVIVWFMGYVEGKKDATPPPAPQQVIIQCPNCNVAK